MYADQTHKAFRLNVGQELGSVQSMSMVTTQLKLIANSKTVKC